jgi:hypothetical protein
LDPGAITPSRLISGGFVADWYVYQHDGDPLGPWSTDTIADAILAGKLAPDVWVAAPGGPRWLRALDVPVIGRLVDGIPTKPRRRDSGLRLIPAAYRTDSELSAIISSNAPLQTAPMTARSPADQTAKMSAWLQEASGDELVVVADDPPTEPAVPPSSATPLAPRVERLDHDAAEAPSTDRRRRRKNA